MLLTIRPIESNPRANTMCGIVGAVSTRNIVPILVQGRSGFNKPGNLANSVTVE